MHPYHPRALGPFPAERNIPPDPPGQPTGDPDFFDFGPELTRAGDQASQYFLPPSLDATGVSDRKAINQLIDRTGFAYLAPGRFYVDQPLAMATRSALRGARPRATGSLGGVMLGTVITPVASFAQGGASTNSVFNLDKATNGINLQDFMIDGSTNGTPDGIASFGNAEGVFIRGVVMYKVNRGIYQITNQGGATKNCDGWNVQDVLIQSNNDSGVIINGFDGFFKNVHCQNMTKYGWEIYGTHNQFYGCRGDVSATLSGIKVDVPVGTNPLDSNLWIGGGTQLNAQHGFTIVNSRAAGKSDPFIIVGATIDGDGSANGTWGGVHVAGPNVVTVTACNINITSASPSYALITDFGSDGTSPPDLICGGGGGVWGGSAGAILDNAGVGTGLVLDPTITYTRGSGLTGFNRRTSTAKLVGGTVTVTSPWSLPDSRIFITNVESHGTPGRLSVTKGTGTFTINSDSGTDTSLIAWQIM